MRKSLFALLLSSIFILPAIAQDWTIAIKKVQNAIVRVETDEGSCTGFVVNKLKQHVQTVAHCYGDRIWVDSVVGVVVSKDVKQDLMLLKVEDLDPDLEQLVLAKEEPAIGQRVISAGFGYGLERPFFRMAMVSDNAMLIPDSGQSGPFIAVDSGFIAGQSGGPVVNVDGEVVSIVQRASDKLGIGVGSKIIRSRMGRFWAVK